MDLAFSTMAARSEVSPARWRWPFLSWMDGIEEGWAIPLLLFGFVAVWFLFLVIAYLGGDLHSDVLETWSFGRSIEWGYSKHPPLMGWVAHAWTSVFPLTNWSFQLMALANSALALWAVDLISRRFVAGDKRMIVLLLLMLLPIYQFHAQRFNANAVLLAVWPIATYCFLRSFETREIRWAIAAGAAGALVMLGKYYSVFLLVSFAFAAICHPQRRVYWTSWAPWVSIAAGLSALVPHLHWLLISGAPPFAYALARHTRKAFAPSVIEAALFILGLALVLALPAAIWVLMAIVFPVITSVVFGTDMPPIWGLQGLFLFVIVMVCGASYPIPRFYSVNLAVLVIGIAVVAVVVVAPVHALYRNDHPLHEGRNFYSLAAKELTRRWHEQSSAPLAAVGGDEGLAFGTAFYSPEHPVYEERLVVPYSEALPPHVAFRRGWVALCYDEDTACIVSMERTAARAPRFVRSAFVLNRKSRPFWFGRTSRPAARRAPTAPMANPNSLCAQPLPPRRRRSSTLGTRLLHRRRPPLRTGRTEPQRPPRATALRAGRYRCRDAHPMAAMWAVRRRSARMRWLRAAVTVQDRHISATTADRPLRLAVRRWLNPCRSASSAGSARWPPISTPGYARRRRNSGRRSAPRAKAPTAGCSSGAGTAHRPRRAGGFSGARRGS